MNTASRLLVIYWEWTEGPPKGARFWAVHSLMSDGRVRDWPKIGLRALGAAEVTVAEGEGLHLIAAARGDFPPSGDGDE